MQINRPFIVFIFVLSLATVSFSQTPVGTPPPLIVEDKEVLKIESRLIMIPVSVTDGNGQPVKGLGVESFSVREENRNQEITEVTPAEQVPLEIALLFDVSASTDPMFKFEQETAAKFLQDVMRPEDRATIFTIGETPVIVQNRNVAFRSVETIQNIKPTMQFTAFYDTVRAAAKYLLLNAPPKSRKIVIAITDGEDTSSIGVKQGFADVYTEISKRTEPLSLKEREKYEILKAKANLTSSEKKQFEALRKRTEPLTPTEQRQLFVEKRDQIRGREQLSTLLDLQNADSVFYSINPAGSSYTLNTMSQFGQSNMQKFADETGGSAFLPRFLPVDLKSEFESETNKQKNIRMLEKIFNTLKSELQSQYLVQYYSDGEYPASKFIPVDVKVNLSLPQGVKVRSRQGYFVKQQ